MALRTALVLGATGLVGSQTARHLAAHPAYEKVICLVRRPLGPAPAGGRLEERIVDFAALDPSVFGAATDFYCAIGTTMKKAGSREAFRAVDYDLPLRVGELATRSAGVKRIALVSSVGADPRSSTFYLRTKGELEDALARLPLSALHVMRPSLLLGARGEVRTGESIAAVVARATNGLLLGGLRKWRAIDSDLVARAMVAAMVGDDPRPPVQIHEHDAIVALAATS